MSINSREEAQAKSDALRALAKELETAPESLGRIRAVCAKGFELLAEAIDPGPEVGNMAQAPVDNSDNSASAPATPPSPAEPEP